jgi:uncharacterized iron-regulated membrane protein
MRRLISSTILLSLALAPLAAQSTAGWKVRADRSTSATDPDGAGKIQFTAAGKGFHAVNPQAAVYWNPANTAKGAYTLKGTFTLNMPSGHNNYYGLVFGGRDLDGPNQSYLYFLIAQDGSFLVKRRAGDAKTDDVVAKTPNAAIKKPEAGGKSTNVLEVRVGADKIDYVVNGTVVGSSPKTGLTTDGIWGIRVNHLLDVNIDEIGVGK